MITDPDEYTKHRMKAMRLHSVAEGYGDSARALDAMTTVLLQHIGFPDEEPLLNEFCRSLDLFREAIDILFSLEAEYKKRANILDEAC